MMGRYFMCLESQGFFFFFFETNSECTDMDTLWLTGLIHEVHPFLNECMWPGGLLGDYLIEWSCWASSVQVLCLFMK